MNGAKLELPKILETKWIHLVTCISVYMFKFTYLKKLSGSIQSLKVSHRVVNLDILTLEKADPFRAVYESS